MDQTNQNKLRILQWNCKSAVSNRENLENLLIANNINLAFLSETRFKLHKYIGFPSFNVFRLDNPDGSGGVAILLKIMYRFREIDLGIFPGISYIGVQILANNFSITVVSLYIKPKTKITYNEWNRFFSSIPKPFVVGGDFNAHHNSWGCSGCDNLGINLLQAIEENDLLLLNDGSPTYIGYSNKQPSAIDLTICSNTMERFFRWQVLEDLYGSDHLPIVIDCDLKVPEIIIKNFRKWNVEKAEWLNFHKKSEELFKSSDHLSYEQIVQYITSAAESSIPRYKDVKNRKKGKFWWNTKCEEAAKERKILFKIYRNNPIKENLLNYKKQDAKTKKIIKETKRESWREYCSELNKNVPIKNVWQNINRFRNKRQVNVHSIDSSSTWIQDFHAQLTPPWVEEKCSITRYTKPLDNLKDLTQPFKLWELQMASKQNNNTAPGKDNIHYSMLWNISIEAKKHLLYIFNEIWSNRMTIPDSWSDYIIIPVLKPGKKPEIYDSYRPIALASCVLKTYERLVKNRLMFWLEKKIYYLRVNSDLEEDIVHKKVQLY